MNQTDQLISQEKLFLDKKEYNADPLIVSEEVIILEAFIKECIELNLKGSRIVELSKSPKYNLDLAYRTIIRKIENYKKFGIESLQRKENSNKGEAIAFSSETLMMMKDIFTHEIKGGVMIRAYEDTHKHFRKICSTFIIPFTGEELQILNGNLVDVADNKIISHYSTKFEAGIYCDEYGHEYKIGSYASACRYLSTLQKKVGDAIYMKRFGVEDFRNKRQHTMSLNYSHLQPNELIIGDGKWLDLLCISEDWRKVYRPILMGWYDASTRRYCFELAESETSEAIANSLMVACSEWGIPKKCKHDNGAAYLSGRFAQMKEALNIKTELATIKLARSKAIESFHNILDQLLKTSIGYTGNNYVNCPKDTKDRLQLVTKHQREIEKVYEDFRNDKEFYLGLPNIPEAKLQKSKNRFMHISELRQLLNDKLNEYHEKTQGGLRKDRLGKQVYNINCKDEVLNQLGEKANSPIGRYEYKVRTGFRPVFADPGKVAMFTLNFELRKVQIKSGINFNSNEFWNPKLIPLTGETIMIRYSNRDANLLYVYHSDELQKIKDKSQINNEIFRDLKFICIAEKQRMIDYGDDVFKSELVLQRKEEKDLKNLFSGKTSSPGTLEHSLPGVSADQYEGQILQMYGNEQEVEEIKNEETRIKTKHTKPVKSQNKFKDIFDEE